MANETPVKPELRVDYYYVSNEEYAFLQEYAPGFDADFIRIIGYEDGWFVKVSNIDTPAEQAILGFFSFPVYVFNRSTEPSIELP